MVIPYAGGIKSQSNWNFVDDTLSVFWRGSWIVQLMERIAYGLRTLHWVFFKNIQNRKKETNAGILFMKDTNKAKFENSKSKSIFSLKKNLKP